jgi:hypothetical protein
MNKPFRGGTKVGKAAPNGNEGGIVLKSIEAPNPNRHWLFCFWAKALLHITRMIINLRCLITFIT